MYPVLLIDIGSTNTKVTAVDLENKKILGTAKAFTTVESDINDGLNKALEVLFLNFGKIEFKKTLACSSAAGGLKMVGIGLVPDLTAEAARRAALSAGAKVMKVYSYELSDRELNEMEELKPDIVLLTGGTDGGNKKVILHNARQLGKISGKFPVVVAGNKSVSEKVARVIEKCGREARVTENVMPEFNMLNIEPAKGVIREVFLERIVHAKGLSKIDSIIDNIVMPTPSAVLKAAQILASGAGNEAGYGELIMMDIGGATTDVYSVSNGTPTRSGVTIKGLPEPYAKRTVEGDLGVRYSASFLANEVGIENLANKAMISVDQVKSCLQKIKDNPGILPQNDNNIEKLDYALGFYAAKLAGSRHAGFIEMFYTPFGPAFAQTGKDLTNVCKVIGTGGPIINSCSAKEILKGILYNVESPNVLSPKDAEFYIDNKYIMAGMGLLSEIDAETALFFMKKSLTQN